LVPQNPKTPKPQNPINFFYKFNSKVNNDLIMQML